MSPVALALRGIGLVRGGRPVFGPLSFELAPGRLLRVVGANGCGKTSLLRVMCGLLPASAGQVLWHGRPLGGAELASQRLFLGHAPALEGELSVLENLHLACELAGKPQPPARLAAALADAGLGALSEVLVRRLSQGQRKRCALVRLALAERQPLWLLDEPFNALDEAACHWLAGLLRAHLARQGSVVLSTHMGLAPHGLGELELAL